MNQPICVVFAGRQGLDDVESRYSIARIPEVSAYLREAQAFFDNIKTVDHNIDLFSFLNSSDNDFSMRPKLRSLVAAIVQVGLFQRYTKFYGNPSFMVGNNNGASALNVCSQACSFTEMLESSPYTQQLMKTNEEFETETILQDLRLSGLSLEEYGLVKRNGAEFENVTSSTKNCYGLLKKLQQDQQVEQFIHIGPHFDFRQSEFEKVGMTDFSLCNSVDMDPILNSFWKTA